MIFFLTFPFKFDAAIPSSNPLKFLTEFLDGKIWIKLTLQTLAYYLLFVTILLYL